MSSREGIESRVRKVLAEAEYGHVDVVSALTEMVLGVIEGAGERRILTTAEELDSLPEGSVVMECDAIPFLGIQTVAGVFHKFPIAAQEPGRTPFEEWRAWYVVAGHGARPSREIQLPARLLWLPVEEVPA